MDKYFLNVVEFQATHTLPRMLAFPVPRETAAIQVRVRA